MPFASFPINNFPDFSSLNLPMHLMDFLNGRVESNPKTGWLQLSCACPAIDGQPSALKVALLPSIQVKRVHPGLQRLELSGSNSIAINPCTAGRVQTLRSCDCSVSLGPTHRKHPQAVYDSKAGWAKALAGDTGGSCFCPHCVVAKCPGGYACELFNS